MLLIILSAIRKLACSEDIDTLTKMCLFIETENLGKDIVCMYVKEKSIRMKGIGLLNIHVHHNMMLLLLISSKS